MPIQLRRVKWAQHTTQDISRRGMFVRIASTHQIGQILQVRVLLPGGALPLQMSAKVARRILPWAALEGDGFPGIGLELLCLQGSALDQWDLFIHRCAALLYANPDLNRYEVYHRLREPDSLPEPAPPIQSPPLFPSSTCDRSNLIFRARTTARLERFMERELKAGRFNFRVPCEMSENSPVNLRVVHPHSLEEFTLPGRIRHSPDKDRYSVHFDLPGPAQFADFRQFVVSGEVPASPAAAS